VSTLLVKLLLAPSFVVAASLAARRFGPAVGGLVGGLPVVAGPILLAYALDHGAHFAARAAVGTLLGLVSLTAFVVVYAALAGRWPWPACLATGWAAFLAATAVLSALPAAAVPALLLACASFALAYRFLPVPDAPAAGPPPAPPAWDLPARAAAALALVLVLTASARSLGSHLAGLSPRSRSSRRSSPRSRTRSGARTRAGACCAGWSWASSPSPSSASPWRWRSSRWASPRGSCWRPRRRWRRRPSP